MWSHYAAKHTGICLRIRIRDDGPFACVKKVHYSNRSPDADLLTTNLFQLTEIAVLWKAKCWSYEREWRLIKYLDKHKMLRYAPNYLAEVICGCRMDRNAKGELIEILGERHAPVRISEALDYGNKFRLLIDPIMELR